MYMTIRTNTDSTKRRNLSWKRHISHLSAAAQCIPSNKYNEAIALKEAGRYEEAITAFEAMNGYKDSAEQIAACEEGIQEERYKAAEALYEAGKYEEAIAAFEAMEGYKDSNRNEGSNLLPVAV